MGFFLPHRSRRVFSIFKFSKLFPFSDFFEASSRKKNTWYAIYFPKTLTKLDLRLVSPMLADDAISDLLIETSLGSFSAVSKPTFPRRPFSRLFGSDFFRCAHLLKFNPTHPNSQFPSLKRSFPCSASFKKSSNYTGVPIFLYLTSH